MTIDIQEYQSIRDVDKALEKLFSSLPHKSDDVQKAIDFATKAHSHQSRKSGEPYIVHPLLVSSMVAYITGDIDMSIAAILHDVVEDTEHLLGDIEEHFGKNVASMVDGLTKIDYLKKSHISCLVDDDYLIDTDSKYMHSALNLRKVFFREKHNEKVFTIKLCDRLHNLATLDALSEKKQKEISQESLIIYAPIAHRLGMASIKNLIEDLSFKYIYPQIYQNISDYLTNNINIKNTQEFLETIKEKLYQRGLSEKDFEITSRIKHIYSIHMKMQRDGIPVNEVLDICAIRIITNTRLDCYKILGSIHEDFKPLNSKLKDYIALPKENGYQTLHTTVLSGNGAYEIQIRTKDMHQNAEYGIAAHWKYKGLNSISPNLQWFNNLEYKNSQIEEFQELVLHDLYTETVEVFSPKHKVFSLPRGSIVLDFAYAIHSDVGDNAKKAYVNNLEASLLQELHSGDIIHIQKGEEILYHCTWIDMVKTSRAKKHIKYMCAQRLKQKDIQSAYNILSTFFDRSDERIKRIVNKYDDVKNHIEQIPYDIAFFKNAISAMANEMPTKNSFLFLNNKITAKSLKEYTIKHFLIYHKQNIKEINISHCCLPKMGDNIVGFLEDNTLVVHNKLCHIASEMIDKKHPSVFIQWDSASLMQYDLFIDIEDKIGSLAAILKILSNMKADISYIKLNEQEGNDGKNYCHIRLSSRINTSNIQDKLSKKGYKIAKIHKIRYQKNIY